MRFILKQVKTKALLCIHGFGYLRSRDFDLFIPEFKKYHADIEVITFNLYEIYDTNISYQKWVDNSEQVVEMLLALYDELYVLGFSMGGLIATHLAAAYPDIKKLVLIAPAYEHLNRHTLAHARENSHKKLPVDAYELDPPNYLFVAYVNEFFEFLRTYKGVAEYNHVPTIIIHSDTDEYVPFSSSLRAVQLMKGDVKLYQCVDGIHELLVCKTFYKSVTKLIASFIEN